MQPRFQASNSPASVDKRFSHIKHTKNGSTSTLQLFYAKNDSKKQLIFEKLEHFVNGQKWLNAKAIAHAKWAVWVKN